MSELVNLSHLCFNWLSMNFYNKLLSANVEAAEKHMNSVLAENNLPL